MNKKYENLHKYDFLTEDILKEEYLINKLTDREIAKKYNVASKVTVWIKRKKFGIGNRFLKKSNKNASVNRKFNISLEEASSLLNSKKTYKEISEKMGCSIMVSRRRFDELGLVDKQNHTISFNYYDIILTDKQRQFLYGSLLGDGSITNSGAYSCSHSSKQKEYLDLKIEILNNLHSGHIHKFIHKYSYFKSVPESFSFTTGCNKEILFIKNIYYNNNKKIFPYEFAIKNLEAEGLAYWYMDDGCKRKNSAIICTYGYKDEEQLLFKLFFKEKFNLDINIQGKEGKRKSLYIPAHSVKDFVSLISPYIIPSMRYKIVE